MTNQSSLRFIGTKLRNYKAFKDFSLQLGHLNVLTGRNNSGKSTLLNAFRILSEGIRKARTRNPELVAGPDGRTWGHRIPLEDLPVASENIFYDYDDSQPASIEFYTTDDTKPLTLYFPETHTCYFIPGTKAKPVKSAREFNANFDISVGFVPILGPVEHKEPLYQKETARLALLGPRAARSFRNIWHHYPTDFDTFRCMLRQTWPGADITPPQVDSEVEAAVLHMFFYEGRALRELYWSGFGFQSWCQMLTYIVQHRNKSLFVIDEPEVYLHPDLQRQLVGLLTSAGPNVLIATHSTEIVTTVPTESIVVIDKTSNQSHRLPALDPSSTHSPFFRATWNNGISDLTRSGRLLIAPSEEEFEILSLFAAKIDSPRVAYKIGFAVVTALEAKYDFARHLTNVLGPSTYCLAVATGDDKARTRLKEEAEKITCRDLAVLDVQRPDLYSYIVDARAIAAMVRTHIPQTDRLGFLNLEVHEIVDSIVDNFKKQAYEAFMLTMSHRRPSKPRPMNSRTSFEKMWKDNESRMSLIAGKSVLQKIQREIQVRYGFPLTVRGVIDSMTAVPPEIRNLIHKLESFTSQR